MLAGTDLNNLHELQGGIYVFYSENNFKNVTFPLMCCFNFSQQAFRKYLLNSTLKAFLHRPF